jgi:hypothetical protein
MPVIRFTTNIPQALRLNTLEGRSVESQFGGVQHMFSAAEGAFYVSEAVGRILTEQLRKLEVRAGEPVEITKREVAGGNGRKSIQWQVARVEAASGKQTADQPSHEMEQKLAASIEQVALRKNAAQAHTADAVPAWAEALVAQTNALVDAYAQVLKHSSRHEGLVKSEDIRSIFLSAFINVSKGANGRAA